MKRKQFDDTTRKKSKKTGAGITVVVFIIIIALSAFGYMAYCASTDKIYEGLSVGNVDMGGLSGSEAEKKLSDIYSDDFDAAFKFSCDGAEFDIYSSQIEFKTDIKSTVKELENYGKKGNIFSKIKAMRNLGKKPVSLDVSVTCNKEILQYQINEKLPESIIDVQQHTVKIEENRLVVNNGKSGMGANIDDVIKGIRQRITKGNTDDVIEFGLVEIKPEPIDPDKFYEEYNREAKNAESIENGNDITIVPEQTGIEIDKNETFSILEKNKDNAEDYYIPAIMKYPEITSLELEKKYADTVLGTYYSDYSTSSENRKENIRLASQKINGMFLNPGEVFSFNDVVGPRTEATGFKIASVYSGNEVVDGIGGGICQVSSTLYNAALLADLEIVYRVNHSIPVTYVPLGRDATVSYGTIDFKFKNNKSSPVKIEVIADGANLTVNIYGRAADKKDVTIETKIVGTVPFTTNEIKDDTMYEGEKQVVKSGSNGSAVEAFRIVSENGEVISRTSLPKSNYSPVSATVKVGTMKKPEASGTVTASGEAETQQNTNAPEQPSAE